MSTHTAPLDGDFGEEAAVGGSRPISVFVSPDVVQLDPATSLRGAAEALRTSDVSLAVIGRGTDVEGVISERDLVNAIADERDLDNTTVAEIESGSLHWAVVTSRIDTVAEEMLETYVRHILVRDEDGVLAGVVSMRDMLAAMLT
jgi:CBS domain-containing protein